MVTKTRRTGGATNIVAWPNPQARNSIGSPIFAAGDSGAAHVIAHRLLDSREYGLGHTWLGQWLDTHAGSGSEWIHLQFHMAVFELAIDDRSAAYRRFIARILPAAGTSLLALTDAPAIAWRLKLRASSPTALHWETLRRTALAAIERPAEPFVTVHHLLAFAGAGDSDAIQSWLESNGHQRSRDMRAVARIAKALLAALANSFEQAARLLSRELPELERLGGSQAQNALFGDLVTAWRGPGCYRDAA